ncbi:hypothetical protein HNP40_000088 [Mycobacteroides chelonae]|nr:hypothetical protein [Mycobacteroides chelonae]
MKFAMASYGSLVSDQREILTPECATRSRVRSPPYVQAA